MGSEFLLVSITLQDLQCRLIGSVSKILPDITEIEVTTPLSDEYPRLYQVPSTGTPVSKMSSLTSLAAFIIDKYSLYSLLDNFRYFGIATLGRWLQEVHGTANFLIPANPDPHDVQHKQYAC